MACKADDPGSVDDNSLALLTLAAALAAALAGACTMGAMWYTSLTHS
jgi:hypothetical protein